MTTRIAKLSDIASEAHTRIQKNFREIDPIIGVNRRLRDKGFPVDTMTIDCLKTRRRIIILLNDQTPSVANFQFAYIDHDPSMQFSEIPFKNLTAEQVYDWIKSYFSK